MANRTDKNGEESSAFNPLAWGILFFSLWLSLQTFEELSCLQQWIGWFFVFLSAVMFCSIFIKCLRKILTKPGPIGLLIQFIFFASLMGFAFSLVQSWTDMVDAPHLLYVSVIGGILWFIAYLLILVRIVADLGEKGTWFGTAICIALIGIGISKIISSDTLAGSILIALSIVSILIIIKKPQFWHKWPLV